MANEEEQFMVGDVVYLKSGGHPMGVLSIDCGCNHAEVASVGFSPVLARDDDAGLVFVGRETIPVLCLTRDDPLPVLF